MPNYFTEGDVATPTDTIERSMAKVVSQLPSFLGGGVDADAAAYIALSGATDVAGINAFVTGVKDFGLWDTFVCWPLRSTQNAGSGNTVYSLGGLGTYNGTLVNAPGWTANGLTFDAVGENVQIPNEVNLRNARSGMVVFNPSSTGANQGLIVIVGPSQAIGSTFVRLRFYGDNNTPIRPGIGYVATRNTVLSDNASINRTANLGTWRTNAFTADNSSDNVFENGTLAADGARSGLAALNPGDQGINPVVHYLFGASSATTGAFAALTTSKWTDSQVATLHNIYKTTLGAGLGLP